MNNGAIPGTLFIITGPSGAGKGTVLGQVMPSLDRLYYSISATTRAPRAGENEGSSYFFKTRQQFEAMIACGELLEHAEYVGNCYGTPAGPVDCQLAQGCDVILEIEVQGALMVKQKRPEAVLIFITPPTFDVLETRLRGRGSEPDDVIEKRLNKARNEYESVEQYDYIVINDDLDRAVEELRSIIIAMRCRTGCRKDLLQ